MMIKDKFWKADNWAILVIGILIGGTIWDIFWIYQIVRLGHGL